MLAISLLPLPLLFSIADAEAELLLPFASSKSRPSMLIVFVAVFICCEAKLVIYVCGQLFLNELMIVVLKNGVE